MAKEISKNTLMILLIVAVAISVLSLTLSMVAVHKVSVPHGGQAVISPENGGHVSLNVEPQPSESGSMVVLEVTE